MKKHSYVLFFFIILAAGTLANLISFYIAAQVAQQKLNQAGTTASSVSSLLSLFSKPSA